MKAWLSRLFRFWPSSSFGGQTGCTAPALKMKLSLRNPCLELVVAGIVQLVSQEALSDTRNGSIKIIKTSGHETSCLILQWCFSVGPSKTTSPQQAQVPGPLFFSERTPGISVAARPLRKRWGQNSPARDPGDRIGPANRSTKLHLETWLKKMHPIRTKYDQIWSNYNCTISIKLPLER